MLQGIAFDYDGTIGMTMERQFNWFKFWAKENNKTISFKDIKEFIPFYNKKCSLNGGVLNVYEELELPCDMNDKTHPVWSAYEKFKKENPSLLYPGIKETIQKIWELGNLSEDPKKNRRIRIAINTTNTWKSIYSELKKENMLHCFDSFITEEVLKEYHGANNPNSIKKPSKISLALICGLIDSEGGKILHIGDTINDLVASYKVVRLNPSKPETLITVGAAWGYEGKEKLEKGAKISGKETIHFNHIADEPKELINIVESYI